MMGSKRKVKGAVRPIEMEKKAYKFTLSEASVKELRKEFLMLMKNIKRIGTYDQYEYWKQGISTWRERYEEFYKQIRSQLQSRTSDHRWEATNKKWAEWYLKHLGEKTWPLAHNIRPPGGHPRLIMKYERISLEDAREEVLRRFHAEKGKWEGQIRRASRNAWKFFLDLAKWADDTSFYGGGGESLTLREDTQQNVRVGPFQIQLDGMEPEYAEDLERIKVGLELYAKRAAKVAPILIRGQLPIVIHFSKSKGDAAATYEKNRISVWPWGARHSDTRDFAKIMAHEMGHHVWQTLLKRDAREFWKAAIRGDYKELDLRTVMSMMRSTETIGDFSKRIRKEHPILNLQIETLMYGGYAGYEIWDVYRVQEHLDEGKDPIVHVPAQPITGYANKNKEEAFCEALGMLVGYGPRTVFPQVRGWLNQIVPGLKISSHQASCVVSAQRVVTLYKEATQPIYHFTEFQRAATILSENRLKKIDYVWFSENPNYWRSPVRLDFDRSKLEKLATLRPSTNNFLISDKTLHHVRKALVGVTVKATPDEYAGNWRSDAIEEGFGVAPDDFDGYLKLLKKLGKVKVKTAGGSDAQRVAEKHTAARTQLTRHDGNKVTYNVKSNSGAVAIILYYGRKRIGAMNAFLERYPERSSRCSQDVWNLLEKYPEVEDTSHERRALSDGIPLTNTRALKVYKAFITDETKQGLGFGKLMYQAMMKEWFEKVGSFLFMPMDCDGSGTSFAAERVWKSLGRTYPSSGDVLAVVRRPNLGRVGSKFQKKKEVPKADGKGTTTVYEYSEGQIQHRNREKAKKVDKLSRNITKLRSHYKSDLTSKDDKTRLSALAVALMDETFERVGNDQSAKEGHFGVTGWQLNHVTFSGSTATVKYTGKSGVDQTKKVTSAAAVKALKAACSSKKGTDCVFGTDDFKLTASDVNVYLKPFNVTAKDLRGFHANREMCHRLKSIRTKGKTLPTDKKKRTALLTEEFKKALEETSKAVGHEASTLKSQYLVPGLEDDYIKDGSVKGNLAKESSSITVSLGTRKFVIKNTRGLFWEAKDSRTGEVYSLSFTTATKRVTSYSMATRVVLSPATSRGTSDMQSDGSRSYRIEEFSFPRSEGRFATKSPGEREDEEAAKNVKPSPKKKPPRHDLRQRKLQTEDSDVDGQNVDKDKDMSLNYKKVSGMCWDMLSARKVASRYFTGIEFDTKEQLKEYLDNHPDSDPHQHTVKDKVQPGKGKEEDAPKKRRPAEEKALEKIRKRDEKEEAKGKGKKKDKSKGKNKGKKDKGKGKKRVDTMQGFRQQMEDETDEKVIRARSVDHFNKKILPSLQGMFAPTAGGNFLDEMKEGLGEEGFTVFLDQVVAQISKMQAAPPSKVLYKQLKKYKKGAGKENDANKIIDPVTTDQLLGKSKSKEEEPDEPEDVTEEPEAEETENPETDADKSEESEESEESKEPVPEIKIRTLEEKNAQMALAKKTALEVAQAFSAEAKFFKPLAVAGKPLASKMQAEEVSREPRAEESFAQYSVMDQDDRNHALDTWQLELGSAVEGGPRHNELNALIDSAQLVALMNDEKDPGGRVGAVAGRKEPSKSFRAFAKALGSSKEGREILFGDMHSLQENGVKNRETIVKAYESLDDDDFLIAIGQDKDPGPLAKALKGGKLNSKSQKMLRALLSGAAADDMLVGHHAVADLTEKDLTSDQIYDCLRESEQGSQVDISKIREMGVDGVDWYRHHRITAMVDWMKTNYPKWDDRSRSSLGVSLIVDYAETGDPTKMTQRVDPPLMSSTGDEDTRGTKKTSSATYIQRLRFSLAYETI